jgi:hypothetical protein
MPPQLRQPAVLVLDLDAAARCRELEAAEQLVGEGDELGRERFPRHGLVHNIVHSIIHNTK